MNPSSMPLLTHSEELQRKIAVLAGMEPGEAPFLSCYLDLSPDAPDCRGFVDRRTDELRRTLGGSERAPWERARELIEAEIAAERNPGARGLALFARSDGSEDFSLSMQFAVPVENHLGVYPAPYIYPLMELRDTHDRYLLALIQPGWLKVIDVNLGDASPRAWAGSPQPCWSPGDHGGLHGPGQESWGRRSRPLPLESQARLIERLMLTAGRAALILAGDPGLVEAVGTSLPPALQARLVARMPMPAGDDLEETVGASLRAFIEFEERGSRAVAASVVRGVGSAGLAVAGGPATLQALREGRADTLVIARTYVPEPGWMCGHCSGSRIGEALPKDCPWCGGGGVQPLDLRAELARLAGRQGLAVEVVADADELMSLGGVGCLLRRGGEAAPVREGNSRLRLVA